jgi:hypothetical protein
MTNSLTNILTPKTLFRIINPPRSYRRDLSVALNLASRPRKIGVKCLLPRGYSLSHVGIYSKSLAARCFLRDTNMSRWKALSPKLIIRRLSGHSLTAEWLGTTLPSVPSSCLVISILFFFFGRGRWSFEKNLAGKWSTTGADVKQAITACLQTLGTNFCYAGLEALVPHWVKGLNTGGNYT